MSIRKLFYALPVSWRYLARRAYYFPKDLADAATGKRDPLVPPKGMIFTGAGDFRAQGKHLVEKLQKLGGLEPHHRVLDIGSGIGRVAVGLTDFLTEAGSYEGFDVMERGVLWCQKNITTRFPNFKFRYVPLKNDLYRDTGKSAEEFRFSYADNEFDLTLLTSVFTHMQPEETAHYLTEIARTLKPGGVCFATFFLFSPERKVREQGEFSFPHDYGHYRLMDDKIKSANIAFSKKHLRQMADAAGLHVENIHFGWWADGNRSYAESFQDIVIFRN